MGARSQVEVVHQPWPVVYDALLRCLPSAGFTITGADPDRGRIDLETRNTRLTVAVGAIDAISSEWMATSELKLGLFRDRHEQKFAAIRDALERYLAAYYA
ncbi:MAG TPA: hypothetical protein VLR27_09125 [Acidimicrobiales bacterium]|nr:hypothetical protein [Acidimicrobiales bacterium]